MIKQFLLLSLCLPLSAAQPPQFVVNGQGIVLLLEQQAEAYLQNFFKPKDRIAQQVVNRFGYEKNLGELHEIIDGAYQKMVKQNSNKLLTRTEFEAGLHKLILEDIFCKEIEHYLKRELKLQ